ncbi:hypothetical protein LNP74_05385 [Klebsiella pneumoniae subsp. pneumoniae]|nr:hypothetical protein [Klebsiella pneumoniae subsp. pneumoniae]
MVYYSLAISHHLGVIDCLESGAELPVGRVSGMDRHPPGIVGSAARRREWRACRSMAEIVIDSRSCSDAGQRL